MGRHLLIITVYFDFKVRLGLWGLLKFNGGKRDATLLWNDIDFILKRAFKVTSDTDR